MARLASGREAGLGVIWTCRFAEVVCVARIAVGRCSRVLPINVAGRTCYRRMRPGQRESRLAVIEARRLPGGRRMASLASRWKCALNVVRIGGPGVVVLVTRVAVARRARVFAIYVTRCACHGGMCSAQWERGFAVIKIGRRPRSSGVAGLASRRESTLWVIRIRSLVVVVNVARVTVGWGPCVLVVYVTGGTSNTGVSACQWELRQCVVIEFRVAPGHCAVTRLASGCEPGLRMWRIIRSAVVLLMAAVTIGRRPLVLSACVAGGALKSCVRAGQGKSVLRVIHPGPLPAVHVMAVLAIRGEP